MWTEEIIQALYSILSQEVKAALAADDLTASDNAFKAMRLIRERKADTDLDSLVEQVKTLVGEQLVGEVLLSAAGLPAPELAPAPAAERTPPPAQEPPTSVPPKAEVTPQPPTPQPVPPTLDQETLRTLLGELRQALDDEPQSLEQLPSYISRVQRRIDSVQALSPQSPEAQKASQELVALKAIRKILDETRPLRQVVRTEQERTAKEPVPPRVLDSDQLRTCKQQAENLLGQVNSPLFAGASPALVALLREQVETLRDDAEKDRQILSVQLGEWLTVTSQNRREEIEGQLEKLDPLFRAGASLVPIDQRMAPGVLIAKRDEDGKPWARTTEVIAALRADLLTECLVASKRLCTEAKERLKEDLLDVARERCKTALVFAESPHIKAELEAKAAADQVQSVLRDISQREQERDKAQKVFDETLQTKDPLIALNGLWRAQDLFPMLPGLQAQKEHWLRMLWSQLQMAVRTAVNRSDLQLRQRQYMEALTPLDEAQHQLATLPARAVRDLKELGLDLSEWLQKLSPQEQDAAAQLPISVLQKVLATQERKVSDEQSDWLLFERRLRQAKDQTRHGRLDEKALEDLKGKFSEQERMVYSDEWAGFLSEVARQSGDQAVYDEALRRFNQDPTDASIARLLGGISTGSSLYQDAQHLLSRHTAYAALARARQKLSDSALLAKPEQWPAEVERELHVAASNAAAEDKQIPIDVRDLRIISSQLQAWQAEVNGLQRAGRYAEAWAKLDNEYPNQVQGKAELSKGLRWLQGDLQQKMHDARMPFIKAQETKPGTLSELRQADKYIQELEDHAALLEDGDWLTVNRARRIWHKAEVEDILGANLDAAVKEDVIARLQKPPDEWRELLEHLDELTKHGLGEAGEIQRAAERLRMVALGYLALNEPAQEAIARLVEVQASAPYLKDNPIIGIVRVLRYLEQYGQQLAEQDGQKQDGQQLAEQVVNELQKGGRAAQDLARALRYWIKAYRLYHTGDLELAEDTLNVGLAHLQKLVPEFSTALQQVTTRINRLWKDDAGEGLYEEVLTKVGTATGLEVFKLAEKLRQAGKLLDTEVLSLMTTPTGDRASGDHRLQTLWERLEEKLEAGRKTLCTEIKSLLQETPDDLAEAIQQGEKLQKYLGYLAQISETCDKKVIGKRRSASKSFINTNDDLKALQGFLQEKLATWRRAYQEVTAVRDKLQRLLKGNWRWNTDSSKTPQKELKEVKELLDQSNELPEEKGLRYLANEMETAAREIGQTLEEFQSHFHSSDYDSEEDFQAARQSLAELSQKFDNYQKRIADNLHLLHDDLSSVKLESFFRVRDIYGQPKQDSNGAWIAGTVDEVKSIADAGKILEKRYQDLLDWQKWNEETLQILEELRTHLERALVYLKPGSGGLTKAEALCTDTIPRAVERLGVQLRTVPGPPLCTGALGAAHRTGDDLVDADPTGRLQALRDHFVSAGFLDVPIIWRNHLRQEIETVKQKLGPAHPGQPAGETLLDMCESRRRQLEELCQKMSSHVNHHWPPNSKNQQWFAELLLRREDPDRDEGAEDIAADDPGVVHYKKEYETRQAHVDKKSRR